MRLLIIISLLSLNASFGQIEKEKAILSELCSKEFFGRGYVNNGVNLAADFIAKEFQKAKASPAGENGTYFHHFSLGVNTFPKNVEVAINNAQIKLGVHYLIQPESGSFQGKLNLVKINPFELFKPSKKMEKLIEKIKEGPESSKLAVLIDLTVTENRDSIYMLQDIANAFSQATPVVLKTGEKFMWGVGRNFSKYPIIKVQDSIFSNAKTISMDIQSEFVQDFKTKNVVAKIKGKSSDSCFVFTAHYDHLGGIGTEVYFPGANDNASGTTIIISIANYFAQNPPEYDVYFIAFSGEEAGLVGSKEFVNNPTFDISKIKFLLNLDIMGSGDEGITAVNGTIFKNQFERLIQLNKDKNLVDIVKPRSKTQNSDHYFFQEKGVKTFFIYTMGKNKAYHDIYDKAENLDMGKFENLRTLFIDFIETYP